MKDIFKRLLLILPMIAISASLVSCSEEIDLTYDYYLLYYPDTTDITYTSDWNGKTYTDELTSYTVMPTYMGNSGNTIQLGVEYTSRGELNVGDWNWSSSDESVATVDSDGKVSVVGVGSTTIEVAILPSQTSASSCRDWLLLYVYDELIEATSIEATSSVEALFSDGSTTQLTGTVTSTATSEDGSDATYNTFIWSSSDSSIATIDPYLGIVTTCSGISDRLPCDVTFTATTVDGSNLTSSVTLQIDAAIDPETIDFDKTNDGALVSISQKTIQLEYDIYPSNGASSFATWSSSNSSIATVDGDGLVTLLSYGDFTITATCPACEAYPTGYYDQISFTVPAGWWYESFDFVSTSAYDYLFTQNPTTTNTWSVSNGNLYVTASYDPGYSSTKEIDGVSHVMGSCRRTDVWCHDESLAVINANNYPYFVVHVDDLIANGFVMYQEIQLNYSYSDSTTTKFTLYSNSDYVDSSNRVSIRYLSDDSMLIVYDMAAFSKTIITSDLTTAYNSYDTPSSLSINWFVYGYDSDTVVDGVTYPAMTNYTYCFYNFETFASTTAIDAYIASLGLTEK